MSCHPCIESKVAYGEEAEEKLIELLSNRVKEPLVKTKETFGILDFSGPSVVAELKKRTSDWSYHDEKIKREGWLIPSCKILRGWEHLSEGKKVFFYYYWACDKSLWEYELLQSDFTAPGSHFVPRGHYDQMLHVAVPQGKWKSLGSVEVAFEEDGCWIADS